MSMRSAGTRFVGDAVHESLQARDGAFNEPELCARLHVTADGGCVPRDRRDRHLFALDIVHPLRGKRTER
jgi:hypothetical protein